MEMDAAPADDGGGFDPMTPEMLADVRAYDAAKARLEVGDDELIPLEVTERRLRGEAALRIWREYRQFTQEQLAKRSKVSRADRGD